MEKNMKKLWAGVVNNEIKFFNSNPHGNVQGLQGSRPFTMTGDSELHDDNGNNIVESTELNTGTDGAASVAGSGDGQQGQPQAQAQPTPTA